MGLSKSKYVNYCQCPKMMWLSAYKEELKPFDAALEARFQEGNVVGDMAKKYFSYDKACDLDDMRDENDKPLYEEMIAATKALIASGAENIFEAAFSYDDCYCAVDILHKTPSGYEIYEVKSTTKVKSVYFIDVAYQKWVLEHCGIPVTGVYVMIINGEFVKHGEIDPRELFKPVSVEEQVAKIYPALDARIAAAKEVLEGEEPEIDIGCQCHAPYDCRFREYCFGKRNIPAVSVFDIMGIDFNDACDLYHKGIISPADVAKSGCRLSRNAKRQIAFSEKDEGALDFEKEGVKKFLGRLAYPLYFLDFETFSTAIPLFDGAKPNLPIPFQYSLHVLDEQGEMRHVEFLAKEGTDPRREIAESLVKNIPADVCVIVYWKGFECGRLKELAACFPDLSDHLIAIRENVVDLLDVFRGGHVYNRAMGNSFSIKSVLPALFPNDEELNYHALEDVHNGSEATATFLSLSSLPPEEVKSKRENLLKYCRLDTLAMVRILEWLKEKAN